MIDKYPAQLHPRRSSHRKLLPAVAAQHSAHEPPVWASSFGRLTPCREADWRPGLIAVVTLVSACLVSACEGDGSMRVSAPIHQAAVTDGAVPDGQTVTADAAIGGGSEIGVAVGDGAAIDGPDGGQTKPFSFVAFGDTQTYTDQCPNAAPGLPKVVRDLNPAFMILTGDVVARGYQAGSYESWESCFGGLLDQFPLFPTGGNHDYYNDGSGRYAAFQHRQLFERNPSVVGADYGIRFPLWAGDIPDATAGTADPVATASPEPPDGYSQRAYYAFKHENAYFISLEIPQHNWRHTPPAWLETHLRRARADADIDHIFVYLHQPVYWSLPEPYEGYASRPVREVYGDLLEQYDVTAVFAGHAHMYDHLYVPDDGHTTRIADGGYPNVYDAAEDGIHYITTGGGGGGNVTGHHDGLVEPACPGIVSWSDGRYYSMRRYCGRHFVHVAVDGERITIRSIAVWGYDPEAPHTWTIEEFTIEP